jgi:hypothetical protein
MEKRSGDISLLHVVEVFGEGGGALGAHGDVVRQPHLLDLRDRHVHSLAEPREDGTQKRCLFFFRSHA